LVGWLVNWLVTYSVNLGGTYFVDPSFARYVFDAQFQVIQMFQLYQHEVL